MKLVAICVGGTKFSQKHIKIINIFHFIFFDLFVCLFSCLHITVYSILNNHGVTKCWLPIVCTHTLTDTHIHTHTTPHTYTLTHTHIPGTKIN